MDYQRIESDDGIRYIIPVTLRQVEAAGVELNGSFGYDQQEHESLLDDTSILRIVAGAELDDDWNASQEIYIESYEARIGQPAAWHDCRRIYSDQRGYVEVGMYRDNADRMWTLVPDDVKELIDQAENDLRAEIKSLSE